MRQGRSAICRLYNRAIAVGGRPLVRKLVDRTFSRTQRKNSRPASGFALQRKVEQFEMAHANDRRRNFRRTNCESIQSQLPPIWNWRATKSFDRGFSKTQRTACAVVAAWLCRGAN